MASLESTFRGYIDAANSRQWDELGRFVAPSLVYNGRTLSLDEFCSELRDSSRPHPTKTVDVLAVDAEAGRIGTRVIVREERLEQAIEYPEHVVCEFSDGRLASITAIADADIARERRPHIELVSLDDHRLQDGHKTRAELAAIYAAYVGCINDRTMETGLIQYCHPHVSWGGRQLPLDEYGMLMETSLDSIADLVFRPTVVVVDAAQQLLAVRIEFSGTPVKKYAGAEPNGSAVSFAEHALYWFEGGRIRQVVTVIDWETYRKQLGTP